jgi:hypothetical protein
MKATLKKLLAEALGRAHAAGDLTLEALATPADIHVEVPREEGRGDLASNVAMSFSGTCTIPKV